MAGFLFRTAKNLADPVEIIGKVYVELYAASDARDTDFMAILVDVYPDGRAVRLGHEKSGVIRSRQIQSGKLPIRPSTTTGYIPLLLSFLYLLKVRKRRATKRLDREIIKTGINFSRYEIGNKTGVREAGSTIERWG